MKSNFRILGFLFLSICGIAILDAQCSEAENADMKKYKELTMTQDAQGCSQCAWLANLYCIAENGLYKNDRSEVEKTINATKQNIQFMGDPICCPELLNKSISWGTPQSDSSSESSSESVGYTKEEKLVDDIIYAAEGFSHMIDNVGTSNDLGKEFDALKKYMTANSILADVDPITGNPVDYSSEEKVLAQYARQKAEIEKYSPRFYEVNQTIMNIKDQNVDIGNSIYSTDMSLWNKIGSTIDVLGSDSVIKSEIEKMMQSLESSKEKRLFDVFKSGIVSENIVTTSVVEEFLNRYKGKNDIAKFQANTIVEGWVPNMKYGQFKKLFNGFKIKNFHQGGLSYRVGDSNYYFSTYKKFLVGLVANANFEYGSFDPETIAKFQQKALDILEEYSGKVGIEIYEYALENERPYEMSIYIVWTDYTTKFSSLTLSISPINKEQLIFSHVILDHSLNNEYFRNQTSPFQPLIDEILKNKKQL